MSSGPEFAEVEQPFVDQLISMGWKYTTGNLEEPSATGRESFRDVLLLDDLRQALVRINVDDDDQPWLDNGRVGTAVSAQDLNVSRHIEAQADEEGARIAAATNVLNPYGLIWFFNTMTAVYGEHGALWERSHPFDSARVADLEHLFASAPETFGKFDKTDKKDVAYW